LTASRQLKYELERPMAATSIKNIHTEFGSTWCYPMNMHDPDERSQRVFKTAWFSKAARKALIADAELCAAIRQVMLGQADDLGGASSKSGLARISTAPSSSPKVAGIGSTSICSQRKIGTISATMN
jgi:hypothetical protein